MELGKGKGI